ncbi:MAG: hypothetical protein AB8B80_11660 [Marinicellaceae bacterium]
MEIPKELENFSNQKIPSSSQIDLGFELFEFTSFKNIIEYQKGYRWHGLTNEREKDWKENWIVFGDSNADPLIYNSKSNKILFARHGSGSWSPVLLFSNLDEMLNCFMKISNIVKKAGDNFRDKDFNIRSKYVQIIKNTILNVVGFKQGNKIIEILEIREY